MVAFAVWGLAIVRGLTRFLNRATYRPATPDRVHPIPYPREYQQESHEPFWIKIPQDDQRYDTYRCGQKWSDGHKCVMMVSVPAGARFSTPDHQRMVRSRYHRGLDALKDRTYPLG